MVAESEFKAWVAESPFSADNGMSWKTHKPKAWEETDIDLRVTHCGVCGTDGTMLKSGWGSTTYPIVVGHEIVGVVERVGSRAGNFLVGDIVGVGAQSDACFSRHGSPCRDCSSGTENYCARAVDTYNDTHFNGDPSSGGYGLYHRCPGSHVVHIPPGLPPAWAAPMLCGGITVYAPMKHFGVSSGKRVAVLGLGGLGHFAVMFAKEMGAEGIVGISRSSDKRALALELGCTDYIATAEEGKWHERWARRFDVVISTVSGTGLPYKQYLELLDTDGVLVQVGAPQEDMAFNFFDIMPARRRIVSTRIGSLQEIREMLQLAADTGIKPRVEVRPMNEANAVIRDLGAGKARFRYVLEN